MVSEYLMCIDRQWQNELWKTITIYVQDTIDNHMYDKDLQRQRTQIQICDITNDMNQLRHTVRDLTQAVNYTADTIGFLLDALQQKGIIPEKDVTRPTEPKEPPTASAAPVKPEPTLENVSADLNAFARRNDKNTALALIDCYSLTRKIEDVDPVKYGNLLLESVCE